MFFELILHGFEFVFIKTKFIFTNIVLYNFISKHRWYL